MGDNYFGGASQFAGGGFMPSPALGNDNAYGAGGGQKRSGQGAKREETIRAVTLKQILNDCRLEEEDTFTLDNAPVTNISVVGRIIDVQENATRITYKLHDNTGVLDMVMHMPGGDEEELFQARKRELVQNTYVRAYGTLRRFNNQTSMTAYNIKPIQDFNELAFHNLQVIFQHLHLLRGPAPAAAPTGPTGPAVYGAPQANPLGMGGHATGAMGGGGMPGTPGPRTGDINMDILNVYNNPANRDATGLNLGTVEQQLRNQGMHYTAPQIKGAVEFLVNEGHLYSTIDENHFKSCSS